MKKSILLLLVLVFVVGAGWYVLGHRQAKRPSVVMIMLDTLRADHLGVYGYERATSPHIDAFAKDSVLFRYAVTAAPWTPTSVASMFTGLYASSHGMVPPNSRDEAKKNSTKLSSSLTTMPEIFKANGYSTYAISPNPWITATFGFEQGFDTFKFHNRARADKITDEAIAALKKLQGGTEPFFLYAHYLDPHDPYDPPGDYRKMFEGPLKNQNVAHEVLGAMNRYDGEIAFLDNHLGRLFAFLKEAGLYDNAVILLVGDHGEQFMEHGHRGHGFKVHNEEVHVPLMFHMGTAPRVVDFTVSTVDILPTILQRVGIPAPAGVQGLSLVDDENSRDREGVLTEVRRIHNQKAFTRFDGMKVVLNYGSADSVGSPPAQVSVYNARKDLFEQTPLNDPALADALMKDFAQLYAAVVGTTTAPSAEKAEEVSDETLEQLKSMGYLQ